MLWRAAGLRRRTCALFLALGGLCLSACLVPQDDHVLQDLPATNHPPRIAEDSVSPARLVTTGNASNCPPLTFSAAVEDDDLADLLNANWYVSDLNGLSTLPIQTTPIFNPSGTVRRNQPAELNIDFASANNPLQSPGVHIVELIVADGLVIKRVPQPRDLLPDGGAGTPSFAASYAWVVNVSSGTICP